MVVVAVVGFDDSMWSIWVGRVVIRVERRDMRIEGGGMLVGGRAEGCCGSC